MLNKTRVKVINTNSFFDNKEGIIENKIIYDDEVFYLVSVEFDTNKKIKQEFKEENLQEI